MRKIQEVWGSDMRNRVGRAVFFASVVVMLLPGALVNAFEARAAVQGPGGREPDLSLPLVQQAFNMTEGRFLISFNRYCTLNGPNTANGKGEAATPSQLFDNLYYVGRTDVGAWVLRTSDGLVLLDTLNNPEEAEDIIVPGMLELGLDPDRIELVVLTHSHRDHSGGMPYFSQREAPVMVSEADWGSLGGAPNPQSVIHDGQVVTFGDTSLTFLLIPGHTNGTIAVMFPVFDRGQRHMAVLTGAVGATGGLEGHRTVVDSFEHLSSVTRDAGVDVFLDPHEALIDSGAWEYIMHPEHRRPDQNDLILGADRFQQFIQMVSNCMQARVVMYQQEAADEQR